MKNIFKIALLFLVACSPYAPDKEPLFTLQKQCMAEDLRDWVISKNTAITSLQLPISSCEKADKIIVQGSPGGFLTLTRNIFTPVANTILY